MQIIRDLAALPAALRASRGHPLALVPTMGALHAGHMALVEEAHRRAEQVIATIFVNPLQFGPGEDLGRYPRQEAADLAMLSEAGCDVVWVPSAADLYPARFATRISVTGVSDRWEGAARPGHFDGVATVVAKLLIAVMPQVALFGQKDFQQLVVIGRLVADLALPVEIVGVATVRDADGLALSSRNAYLSIDQRRQALALPQALADARRSIVAGEPVTNALDSAKDALRRAGFASIDYLALVDCEQMEPLDEPAPGARLIVAATLGSTRLIDNIAL